MVRAMLMVAVLLLAGLTVAPTASAGPLNCSPYIWDPAPPPGWTRACNTVNGAYDLIPLDYVDCVLDGPVKFVAQRAVSCL